MSIVEKRRYLFNNNNNNNNAIMLRIKLASYYVVESFV